MVKVTHEKELITQFQSLLEAEASLKTKLWWEKYLKGKISFRGVSIPKNRELLISWRKANAIDTWALENQLDLALAFFGESMAEDKLAGILFLQEFLFDKLPWEILINRYVKLYTDKLIFDWNICDWFCVRVLGPTIKKHGEPCAKAIAFWKDAEYLWQARSSVVSFVKVASKKQYFPYIQQASSILIKREERFAKTAVGWVLREISRVDTIFVEDFIKNNLPYFSKESMKNALKYFDKNKINRFLLMLKNE